MKLPSNVQYKKFLKNKYKCLRVHILITTGVKPVSKTTNNTGQLTFRLPDI